MHARLAEENEPDPLAVFCELGTLVIEARVPGLGDNGRGYGEGPHCPPYLFHSNHLINNNNSINSNNPSHASRQHHECAGDVLCQRFQHLRRHAALLGENRVPLCVEVKCSFRGQFITRANALLTLQVLVGPECCHGAQRAKQVEVTFTSDPDFLLLERWTITCLPKKYEANAFLCNFRYVWALL